MYEETIQPSLVEVQDFAKSHRGQFIQAQALYYGIQKLREVEGVMREESNISDMEFILTYMYPGYKEIFDHFESDIRH